LANAVLAVSNMIIGPSTTSEIGYTNDPHVAKVISGAVILATKAASIGDSIPINSQLPAKGSHRRNTSLRVTALECFINILNRIAKLGQSNYWS